MAGYGGPSYVFIDGLRIKQSLPWSIFTLINGLTGPQVQQVLVGMRTCASTQIPDPFDLAAVQEQEAYWDRWITAPWLPISAQSNLISGILICLPLISIQATATDNNITSCLDSVFQITTLATATD